MRKCEICGKGYKNVTRRSHSMQATKQRLFPNLQWMTLEHGVRVKACTKCLKTRNRKLARLPSLRSGVSGQAKVAVPSAVALAKAE